MTTKTKLRLNNGMTIDLNAVEASVFFGGSGKQKVSLPLGDENYLREVQKLNKRLGKNYG